MVHRIPPMEKDAPAFRGGAMKRTTPPKSHYKGLAWDRQENCWRVRISYQGKQRHVGRFQNQEEAAQAFDCSAYLLFGKNAATNFGDESAIANLDRFRHKSNMSSIEALSRRRRRDSCDSPTPADGADADHPAAAAAASPRQRRTKAKAVAAAARRPTAKCPAAAPGVSRAVISKAKRAEAVYATAIAFPRPAGAANGGPAARAGGGAATLGPGHHKMLALGASPSASSDTSGASHDSQQAKWLLPASPADAAAAVELLHPASLTYGGPAAAAAHGGFVDASGLYPPTPGIPGVPYLANYNASAPPCWPAAVAATCGPYDFAPNAAAATDALPRTSSCLSTASLANGLGPDGAATATAAAFGPVDCWAALAQPPASTAMFSEPTMISFYAPTAPPANAFTLPLFGAPATAAAGLPPPLPPAPLSVSAAGPAPLRLPQLQAPADDAEELSALALLQSPGACGPPSACGPAGAPRCGDAFGFDEPLPCSEWCWPGDDDSACIPVGAWNL